VRLTKLLLADSFVEGSSLLKPSRVLLSLLAVLTAGALLPASSVGAGEASCFDGDSTKRSLMRGDVDGDEVKDAVWLTAERVDGNCRYFVKAELNNSKDKKRLDGDSYTLAITSRIMAMVHVDTVDGKEFGVVLSQGASTVFFGLFTIRANEIKRMEISGDGAPPDDLFGYGGSLPFLVATDCARNRPAGQVIYSEAERIGDETKYMVRRRWFNVEGYDFHRTGEPVHKERVRNPSNHFYEFRTSPLRSCEGRVRG
jgi:hypothetical protein